MKKINWTAASGIILILIIGFSLIHAGGTDLYEKLINGLFDKNSNGYCVDLVNHAVSEGDFSNVATMSWLGGIVVGCLITIGSRDLYKKKQ